MKRILFFSATALLFSFSGEHKTTCDQYAAMITADELKANLSILASDDMEGRETSKPGQLKAADFISSMFRSYGIPELPNKGYYQDVPLVQFTPGSGTVSADNATWVFGEDLYYTSGIDDGKFAASQTVFAGYGIEDSLWNDFTGVDVKGKILMILANEPRDKKGNSLITRSKELSTWSTTRRRKTNLAKEKGAKGMLIVLPDFAASYAENKHYIESPTLKLACPGWPDCTYIHEGDQSIMPVLYISQKMADEILKKGDRKENTTVIAARITKKKKCSFEMQLPLTINIQRSGVIVHSQNVLGYIEGSDLKDQIVVVTAHYDHLGKEGDVVFNGADDDGSGTVAVMEMAKVFAQAKKDGHGPRRSMLFMTVTGEEKGLLGSKWYTDHPVFPMANTTCDLNIDMIGRVDVLHKDAGKYLYVIGSEMLSSELKKIIVAENDSNIKLDLDFRYDDPNDPNSYYTRSDHYNFARKNIPVAFFFNGVHADYHKESDEVSKIDFALMEMRTRLVFFTAWEIANRDQRLIVDKKGK